MQARIHQPATKYDIDKLSKKIDHQKVQLKIDPEDLRIIGKTLIILALIVGVILIELK